MQKPEKKKRTPMRTDCNTLGDKESCEWRTKEPWQARETHPICRAYREERKDVQKTKKDAERNLSKLCNCGQTPQEHLN